jgi:putative ABC transport system permease protein
MTTRWQKVFRDLWEESTRAILVVLAIAVGIAGFAAVLASYAILTRELNNGYLATNPASATMRVDRVDDDLLRAVRADREVADVEARRTVNARIANMRTRGGTPTWRNLVLFVVKDYGDIRISKLQREKGAWPPAAGEILIERDAFQVARTHIGDTVIVKTTGGRETRLRVSGGVHDVGQAQARMENIVYGYITLDTLVLLGEEPTLNRLNILVAEKRNDEQHIRQVVAGLTKRIEATGHRVLRTEIPTPGKHPHAAIMGMLLLLMSSFGLFVMVLSGIIVINLLTAIMAAQVRQIGVMKAIGGTRGQIARIYFGQALILGAAAVAIALPVGVWGSRLLCRGMAVFLNFDITSFSIPIWVYLLVAAIGIVVPLMSAAWPVWKGSGVPIRVALADYGVSRNAFGTSALDRLLGRVGGLTRPVLLAIRNSFRRRVRLTLTLLTLSIGGLFFMAALNVRTSMINTLDHLFASRHFDLSVSLTGMVPYADVERLVAGTPGVAKMEGWVATEATIANDRFVILAIPPGTPMLTPEIVKGRGLQPGDGDALVINSALAAKSPLMRVGKVVTLPVGTLRVVGIAREAFSPPLAYMPLVARGGTVNQLRLVLTATDPASIERVKAELERRLAAGGIQAANIGSKGESRFGFDQHMLMIYVFLVVMSCMLGAVGGLGLMTTMSLNVLERRREMGVLRAIGASPAAVWLTLTGEAVVVGALSWGIAALAAWPVSKGLGDLLMKMMFQSRLDFTFDPRGVAIWLAATLFLAVLASSLPAWHASRRPIREALEYE